MTRYGGVVSAPVEVAEIRAVLQAFYAEVYADPMIGFYFTGVDPARLIERETELVAAVLGIDGASAYRGRPMGEAHARHRILSGHFDRRMVLLRRAIDASGIPEPVRAAWLADAASHRSQIVAEACDQG